MSAHLEMSVEDIDFLIGATLAKAEVTPDAMGEEAMNLHFRLPKGRVVVDQSGSEYTTVVMQVWQDVEGNGPGYLAFVGGSS
jgi:hypothetical protein